MCSNRFKFSTSLSVVRRVSRPGSFCGNSIGSIGRSIRTSKPFWRAFLTQFFSLGAIWEKESVTFLGIIFRAVAVYVEDSPKLLIMMAIRGFRSERLKFREYSIHGNRPSEAITGRTPFSVSSETCG